MSVYKYITRTCPYYNGSARTEALKITVRNSGFLGCPETQNFWSVNSLWPLISFNLQQIWTWFKFQIQDLTTYYKIQHLKHKNQKPTEIYKAWHSLSDNKNKSFSRFWKLQIRALWCYGSNIYQPKSSLNTL